MMTQRFQLQANIPESTTGTKHSKSKPIFSKKKEFVINCQKNSSQDLLVAYFVAFGFIPNFTETSTVYSFSVFPTAKFQSLTSTSMSLKWATTASLYS